MARIVILYENFADSGILAGGNWLAGLPLANMQDPDIRRMARSVNATNAATMFTIDLGLEAQIDGIAFGPINMSPGSTWRWRGYSDADFAELVYDSETQTVSGEVIDWSNPANWLEWENPGFWYGLPAQLDELPQFLFHVAPTSLFAQYWKLELFDAANADGYIEIGRLLLARAFRPSVNYDPNNSLAPEPITDTEEALGGLRQYFERGIRRKATYGFASLPKSELFGGVFPLALRSGISRQVFVVPDPDDLEFGNRRSFLATFAKAPAIQQFKVPVGSTAFEFEEVL